jgi:putative ABC transport system permease protein
VLSQFLAVSAANFRAIPGRLGPPMVMAMGIAGVMGVLIAMLAVREAHVTILQGSSTPDRIVVMSEQAQFILSSSLSVEHQDVVRHAPGVRPGSDGEPLMSELTFFSLTVKGVDGYEKGAMLQGMGERYYDMLPRFEIVEGRMYKSGLHEIIVGRNGQLYYQKARVGEKIVVNGLTLTVVGVFSNGGDFLESSFFMDGPTMRSLLGRTDVGTMVVDVDGEAGAAAFRKVLSSHPRLKFNPQTEQAYYEQLTEYSLSTTGPVMQAITILMFVAGFACAATVMYTSVAARQIEMATYRAIGFGRTPVVISVVVEAVLIGSVGGLLGATGAWYFFDDLTVTSTDGVGGLVTHVSISPLVLAESALWLLGIVVVSALLPGVQAARVPLAVALRKSA